MERRSGSLGKSFLTFYSKVFLSLGFYVLFALGFGPVFAHGTGSDFSGQFEVDKAKALARCRRALSQFLKLNDGRIDAVTTKAILNLFGEEVLNAPKPVDKLKIGTVNTFNLFLTRGEWVREWNEVLQQEIWIKKSDPREKPMEHTAEIARSIISQDLDIVILNEVEGGGSAIRFAEEYLNNNYLVLSSPSNDPRNFETVFLVKRTLPLQLDFVSHTHRTRQILTSFGKMDVPVFARDLPTLLLRPMHANNQDPPSLIIAGAHYKSKGTSNPKDPEYADFRSAEIKETVSILREYHELYGNHIPLILGGDFNGSLWTDNVFKHLENELQLKNAAQIKYPDGSEHDFITHVYFPKKNKRRIPRQMDGFFMSPHLHSHIQEVKVVPYFDSQGNPMGIPLSIEERNQMPADHLPIYVEIMVDHLF